MRAFYVELFFVLHWLPSSKVGVVLWLTFKLADRLNRTMRSAELLINTQRTIKKYRSDQILTGNNFLETPSPSPG